MTDKYTVGKLPERPPKVSDETIVAICRLELQQLPETEIAKRLHLNRRTVHRVLERTRATLAVTADLDAERSRAVSIYQLVQREAWEAIEDARARGRPIAAYLSSVLQSQARVDRLLGLEVPSQDDPMYMLAQFKTTVVDLIRGEAPDVAARLSQRLLEVAGRQNRDDA
jgi:hypothetical protein